MRPRGAASAASGATSWAVCTTVGGTVAAAGVTNGSLQDSVNAARFSTNDAATYATYVDTGTGLTAVHFLQQGLYIIQVEAIVTATSNALGAAALTTQQHTIIQIATSELFGGGSYSRRILDGDKFRHDPATGPSSRGAGGTQDMNYRCSGASLLDLPAGGDNLGDEYGITAAISALTDVATGAVFPRALTGLATLYFQRIGDSVPVASLPWW